MRYFIYFLLLFSANLSYAFSPVKTWYSAYYGVPLSQSLTSAQVVAYHTASTPSTTCFANGRQTIYYTYVVHSETANTLTIGQTYDCGGQKYNVLSYNWNIASTACPANSALQNGSCECSVGYTEENSQCFKDPCDLLADMCSGSQGKTSAFSLSGNKTGVSFTCMSPLSFGGDPLPGCNKGCMAQVGGFTTAFQSDDGSWMTQGTAKYSGSTCDPSVINDLNAEADPEYEPDQNPETSNPPDPSCPGGFKGEVNGVSVCVPPKGSSGTTELEERDNGDGTKTNTKTEVKCENGKCEVTKTSTTTNTATNSTVSSSSVTTTVDKAAYCSQNKTAAACRNEKGEEEGNGKFGGSCSAGFTCEGDALQCAIAKEQHKRNCEMSDDLLKTDEYKAWQTAKAWDGKSVTGNLPGNREHTISLNVGDDFIGSGSCPSDKTIEIPYGLSFTIPFSAMCEWLRLLGEGFVIVAYIVGALIIIRRQS